jgi:hypothetical protein
VIADELSKYFYKLLKQIATYFQYIDIDPEQSKTAIKLFVYPCSEAGMRKY